MILNFTERPADWYRHAFGCEDLVDHYDREEICKLVNLAEEEWGSLPPVELEDFLYDVVSRLVDIVSIYQAEAVDKVSRVGRGKRYSAAIRKALAVHVLVDGWPTLLERLVPALEREGCIPVYFTNVGGFIDAAPQGPLEHGYGQDWTRL